MKLALGVAFVALCLGAAQDDACHTAHTAEAACNADAKCTWCKAGAIPSSCFTKENAKALPSGVFDCAANKTAAPFVTEALVATINSQQSAWTAHVSPRFAAAEEEDIKRLLGTVLKGDAEYKEVLEVKAADIAWSEDVPANFDVRTQWPKCANVSGHIRDQADCGSCWAFGSTEAFNDRRCIATGDATLLSVEDTLANCGFLQCFSMGCNGGQPGSAWKWFENQGVVTGGDYGDIGTGGTCAPYSLKPCAHHVAPSPQYPACVAPEEGTPKIGSACTEKSYPKAYAADKKKAASSYSLSSVAAIQKDMMQYGSVTAAFSVYGDFPLYKSGVYRHTTGSALGGHAIKIIGWGVEKGDDYWLVQNSWNDQWGDHGVFKIRRGVDECGIEGQVVAGTVAVSDEIIV